MDLFAPQHLILIVLIFVLLFGGKKIPEVMRGLGQGMGEFQRGLHESKRTLNQAMDEARRDSAPEDK